jgi:hypothetical protein
VYIYNNQFECFIVGNETEMDEQEPKNFESHITSKIIIARDKLQKIVKELKKIEYPFFDLPTQIKPRKIAALDGGGFSEDFVGLTIIPSRAAGAIFEQNEDPIWIEEDDVEILTMDDDPRNFGSLFRDLLEVNVALKLAEMKPEILFLDGSITNFAYKGIPHSLRFLLEDLDKIDEGSYIEKFFTLYQKFIQTAYELITKCILNDIILVGVSKDSRADILMKNLYKDAKNRPPINDVSLINVISNGKVGFTKPIEFKPKISPVRQKVWKAANVFQEKELQSFYLSYFVLKDGAQPIRVDSLLPQKNKLKEIQEAMVTYHDGNGFITPAYLTHKRAHMPQDYGLRIVNLVAEKIFEESPDVYKAFMSKRRRDVIQ